MSDYERYGDYNEIEEDNPRSKSPVMLILKILTAVICIGVVGFLAFRLFLFNTYPDSVKELYVNEELKLHYEEKGGDITVKTQNLRYPYDDEDEGNFFCDYLYVCEEAGQIQITVRYNTSTVVKLEEKYGIDLDENDPDIFTYRLYASFGEDDVKIYDILSEKINASQVMYRYSKLVFDGVDVSTAEGEGPYWIRLEIFVGGIELEEPFMIPIYENNEDNSAFSEVTLRESDFK